MSHIRLQGIHRRFGQTVALDSASLTAVPGEVHAVLGENGAGKTTLLSILAGELSADSGEIVLNDQTVEFGSPRDGWAAGVGMVHQHFALVPRLTVLENLLLGGRERALAPLAYQAMRMRAGEVAASAGLSLDLDRAVESLSVGEQQRVEILKVLIRDPAVLILDEPTAVLTPREVGPLLDLLRAQADQGRTVLLVAHKLNEVLSVADHVTVLRAGRTVLEAARAEVDAEALTRAMVGRGPDGSGGAPAGGGGARTRPALQVLSVSPGAAVTGSGGPSSSTTEPGGSPSSDSPPVASLRSVDTQPLRGTGLQAVSLDVARGEIVGIAGVEGNGQRDLARILAGIDSPASGEVELPAGVGYVPQDRRAEGLIGEFDLVENLALAWAGDPEYRRGPFVRWGALRERAVHEMERFGVRAAGPDARASTLSGGNQQRLVLAREVTRARDLLVAENPTRGLDVAGTEWIRSALLDLVRPGVRPEVMPGGEAPKAPGMVLISTDLDEILHLSDRVFVLLRGELTPVPADALTREGIGRLMVGSSDG